MVFGESMIFLFTILIGLASAQQGGCSPDSVKIIGQQLPVTESMKLCLDNAVAKCQMLEKSQKQCKWKLPEVVEGKDYITAEKRSECSVFRYDGADEMESEQRGRDADKNKGRYKRKSTYTGSGHEGILDCANKDGATVTSHRNQNPMITYECARCSTTDPAPELSQSCREDMFADEVKMCKQGRPKMNFRYNPGKDPVPVNQ